MSFVRRGFPLGVLLVADRERVRASRGWRSRYVTKKQGPLAFFFNCVFDQMESRRPEGKSERFRMRATRGGDRLFRLLWKGATETHVFFFSRYRCLARWVWAACRIPLARCGAKPASAPLSWRRGQDYCVQASAVSAPEAQPCSAATPWATRAGRRAGESQWLPAYQPGIQPPTWGLGKCPRSHSTQRRRDPFARPTRRCGHMTGSRRVREEQPRLLAGTP